MFFCGVDSTPQVYQVQYRNWKKKVNWIEPHLFLCARLFFFIPLSLSRLLFVFFSLRFRMFIGNICFLLPVFRADWMPCCHQQPSNVVKFMKLHTDTISHSTAWLYNHRIFCVILVSLKPILSMYVHLLLLALVLPSIIQQKLPVES